MALKKTIPDFEPDMYYSQQISPGLCLKPWAVNKVRWPGHGVSLHHTHQFIKEEYMKADRYEAFLKDLSDYALRTYMPHIYGSLESLKMP